MRTFLDKWIPNLWWILWTIAITTGSLALVIYFVKLIMRLLGVI